MPIMLCYIDRTPGGCGPAPIGYFLSPGMEDDGRLALCNARGYVRGDLSGKTSLIVSDCIVQQSPEESVDFTVDTRNT